MFGPGADHTALAYPMTPPGDLSAETVPRTYAESLPVNSALQTSRPDSAAADLIAAVPTDTSAVAASLLTLSDRIGRDAAVRQQEGSVIPHSAMLLLLRIMKLRDPALIRHGERMATIATGLARCLGWDDSEQRVLEVAAVLHDLGKIGVPEHMLRKPGRLSCEESDVISQHHQAAVCLLQALHAQGELIAILTALYQNYDAAGVERDAVSDLRQIPLGSRILAVADAYDSLSSPKPWRRGMPHREVMQILRDQEGTRYDGTIISTLARWHESEGHRLLPQTDPFTKDRPSAVSEEARNEVIVVTQILQMLYEFQTLYDGYFLLSESGQYRIWSDGMPGLSGRSVPQMLGRSWRSADVRLSPVTQTGRRSMNTPQEEIVPQVLRSGRAQFCSRVCTVHDTQQLSVDVYTLPLGPAGEKPVGVVQLFRSRSGVRRRTREYAELRLAATRDPLTGVASRGQLETQLRHMIDDFHNHEASRPLSVVFLDVDHFKSVNDTFGHKAGDQVLVDLTQLLQNETYSGEIIGRYGGEEFVLLCPDTDLASAVRRAERLRQAIQNSSIGGISGLNVTSSFGVAAARLGDSVQTLLERADVCLFRAKEAGRNSTCCEDEELAPAIESAGTGEETACGLRRDSGGLQYHDCIHVSTSLELTALKLDAFIAAAGATVKFQECGHLLLQMGRRGWTGRWGRSPERQPVTVDVQFETRRRTDPMSGREKTVYSVCVVLRPVGREPDPDVFETRCVRIVHELRGYLLSS